MQNVKDDMRVIESNVLIESKYNLTLSELKLLLYMVKEVSINDKDFKQYQIFIKSFVDAQKNIDARGYYTKAKKLTKDFLSKVLEIKEGDKLIQTHFMSSIIYKEGQAYITYSFDPLLKPHLLRLKSSFCSFDVRNVLDMKSIYSVRIYQLLKSFEGLKQRSITVEELKRILGVENKYKLFADFKRHILEISKRDCKKYSDLFFDYSVKKKGRKAHMITFHIKRNKQMRLFDGEEYITTDEVLEVHKRTEKKLQELEDAAKDSVAMPDELKKKIK
jgi:plasmid replication initiation protein